MSKQKFNRYTKKKEPYAFPVPERDVILTWIEAQGKPVHFKKLVKVFDLSHEEEQQGLEYRLKAMLRDGQLWLDRRSRYGLPNKLNLIEGTIFAHSEGFGFLENASGGEDLYLSARQMRRVFHRDRVLAQVLNNTNRGKGEAQISEVIERNTNFILGRLHVERDYVFVRALRKEIHHDLYVPQEYLNGATVGDLVNVRVIVQPDLHTQPIVAIVEILPESKVANESLYTIARKIYGIPDEWSESVQNEIAQVQDHISETAIITRKDLRNLPFVTIDGEDACDFDDAVYCHALPNNGWLLSVAIADVSHYVLQGSALDESAQVRGNSIYFPTAVIPMLPEVLSNGLCSLKPNVDRLSLVCEMKIGSDGRLGRHRFYEAVIRSKARLTYTQVNQFFSKISDQHGVSSAIQPALLNLYALYQVLLTARHSRGALELDTAEPTFELDSIGAIAFIRLKRRNEAHRLIEECMLLANVAAARFLKKSNLPALYRNHEKPEPERVQAFRSFLSGLGLQLLGGSRPHTKHYTTVLAQARLRDDFELIQLMLLRSLNQAVYAEKNQGHFGLAYPAYTHFTSPIRRYPDLMVQRMIKNLIIYKTHETFLYTPSYVQGISEHCSMTERRADEATRFVSDTLKCHFMADKLGEVFEGKIVAVTKFGVFVRLNDFFIEGLLHITVFVQDDYHFDAIRNRLVGDRTGHIYELLQDITVRIARVCVEDRQIDFDLIEE